MKVYKAKMKGNESQKKAKTKGMKVYNERK